MLGLFGASGAAKNKYPACSINDRRRVKPLAAR